MPTDSVPSIPVSVIIPNYNSGGYLRECIDSINTGSPPEEIIIIDDVSTDGSADVAAELSVKYSNVRVILRERNEGALAARRVGVAVAKNDWVAIVDADDVLEENAIACAYLKAQADGSDLCIWDMWRFDAFRSWPNMVLKREEFPKSGRQAVIETLGKWKIHPSGVARKALYVAAYDGFSETCFLADELLTRLVFAGANKVSCCDKKYLYRVNPGSSTQKVSLRHLTTLDMYMWLQRFSRSYPEVGAEAIGTLAITHAWGYWVRRREYGVEAVYGALTKFLPEFVQTAVPQRWLWRFPKHLFAFAVIYVATKSRAIQ